MENFYEQLALLPDYLSAHVLISMLAITTGIVVSVPLAILIAKWCTSLQWLVLTSAGVIQTVPSIALLALMVLVLGIFGFWPAFIALTLYSILPILRNTTTGLTSVDPAMTEAALGLGMTPAQSLWKVELPLALPVIIAGIRTATVWVVGIATLSTPVGQESLGNYIFSGLQTQNLIAVSFGVVAAAVLAIIFDAMIALLQQGVENRRTWKTVTAVTALLTLVFGGLTLPAIADSLSKTSANDPDKPRIAIGAKTFTEQYILADLLQQRLSQDFNVDKREGLGSTIGFEALVNNNIQVFVDYTGTIWANYMKKEGIPETNARQVLLNETATWLMNTHGIRSLGSLGFENAYALAMSRKRAEELGVESIEDLVKLAPELSIGSDYEFFARPEWYKLRDTYGLNFADQVSMDSSLMYQAVAQGRVDVITAFSSDGRIAAFDLIVLADPRGAFPPYDAVVLLSPDVSRNQEVMDDLQPLIGEIPVTMMQQANQKVDVDGQGVGQAANWLNQQIKDHE